MNGSVGKPPKIPVAGSLGGLNNHLLGNKSSFSNGTTTVTTASKGLNNG